jgi:hypothetical protein
VFCFFFFFFFFFFFECGAIYSELHSAIFHETAVDTAAAISSA